MRLLQQLKYCFKDKKQKNGDYPIQNLQKTDVQGITFDDELVKRYLYLKFLNRIPK